MPTAKNQHTIFAGTQGIFSPDPDLFGPVTVEPIFPGSFQAKRKGYRWVCRTASGDVVFIPFRDFVVQERKNEGQTPLSVPAKDVN